MTCKDNPGPCPDPLHDCLASGNDFLGRWSRLQKGAAFHEPYWKTLSYRAELRVAGRRRPRLGERRRSDRGDPQHRPGSAALLRAVAAPRRGGDRGLPARDRGAVRAQGRARLDESAIASTKREIATLRRSEDDGGGMRRAAGELDAVIEATEDATTTILAAAEEIESHATMLRAAGVATGNNDCVGAILTAPSR